MYIPPETGTAVIRPNVTNMLYVTAALNCIRTWKTAIKINYGDKSLRHNKCRRSGGGKGVLPRSRRLAANSRFQGMLSEVRLSVPVR